MECFNCKFIDKTKSVYTGLEMYDRLIKLKDNHPMCKKCVEYWENFEESDDNTEENIEIGKQPTQIKILL